MKSTNLSVNYSFLLMKNLLLLLSVTISPFEDGRNEEDWYYDICYESNERGRNSFLFSPGCCVNLGTDNHFYQVYEGNDVSVRCFINCSSNSRHNIFWNILVPGQNKNTYTRLDPLNVVEVKEAFENTYGIQTEFRNASVDCTNGSKKYFYLDIIGVKANMSHSVLICGLGTPFKTIPAAIHLLVHRVEPAVTAISEVNYATDNEVTVSCHHSCDWTSLHSDYLLLWKLNTFYYRDLGAIELHDNYSKTIAENELQVKFTMTSDDGCSVGDDFSTFSLNIMNVNASLQHAVVSCGVRVDMDSPEIYSSTDSYIVINETKCITTDIATTPTTSVEATTSTTSDEATTSTASDDITTPTTNDTAIAEPPDRVVEIAVPAAIVALLFGLVTGGLVSGLTVYLLTKRTKLDKMAEAHNVEVNMAVAASNPINKETFEESELPPVKDCR